MRNADLANHKIKFFKKFQIFFFKICKKKRMCKKNRIVMGGGGTTSKKSKTNAEIEKEGYFASEI